MSSTCGMLAHNCLATEGGPPHCTPSALSNSTLRRGASKWGVASWQLCSARCLACRVERSSSSAACTATWAAREAERSAACSRRCCSGLLAGGPSSSAPSRAVQVGRG